MAVKSDPKLTKARPQEAVIASKGSNNKIAHYSMAGKTNYTFQMNRVALWICLSERQANLIAPPSCCTI